MTGAIFYSGQYGSTAQYAAWIGEATGLPVFDVKDHPPNPSSFEFLVIGSSVIIYKLTIRHWAARHLQTLLERPACLFTVSGAPGGEKLNGWIQACLPSDLVSHVHHVPMRGRLDHQSLGWWMRLILKIGAWKNDDAQARNDELNGFDYMDKTSIEPVVQWTRNVENKTIHQADFGEYVPDCKVKPKTSTQAK